MVNTQAFKGCIGMPIRKPPKNRDYFVIAELAQVTGLTTDMVTYLERTDVFTSTYTTPTGEPWRRKGSWRRYTFRDIVLLKVIAKILTSGIQVRRLRSAMINLRENHPEIAFENRMAKYLVTDGEEVFFQTEDEKLETLASGQFAFSFILEFDALHQDVVAKLSEEQINIDQRFRQRCQR